MGDATVSVLLVDDHAVVRAGFRYLLERVDGFVVIESDSAEAAYRIYREKKPDVVVIDMSMPGIGGLEGIRRLRASDETSRIIVLSMYNDPSFVTRAVEMGALGYLSKNCGPEELAKAIAAVMQGERYFSSDIALEAAGDAGGTEISSLSTREFQVFRMLAEGASVKDIADTLSLSPKTVNNHRSNIMEKLQIHSAVEMTRLAVREGIIDA